MITIMIVVLALTAIVLAYFLGRLSRYEQLRRIRTQRTVIAEYEVPKLLTPAEVGYITDKEFSSHELLAVVTRLIQKGFLKIVKHEKDNPLITITDKQHNTSDNLDYSDIAIISWIRGESAGSVPWKELDFSLNDVAGIRDSFEHEVRLQLVEKGYILPFSVFSIRAHAFSKAKWISFLLVVLLAVWLVPELQNTYGHNLSGSFGSLERSIILLLAVLVSAACWPFVFLFIQLLQFLYRRGAGFPINATDSFKQIWPDVAGFQLFIRTVEFSRLDADTNPYDESMPYAIALGFNSDLNKMVELAQRG